MNKQPVIRTLVILRHAHRDKNAGSSVDNGLSEKGRKQAKRLAKFLRANPNLKDPKVFSSPKRRCIETVAPLSDILKADVQIEPLLNEGGNCGEQARRLVNDWKEGSAPLTIWCSHGDLIPYILGELTGFPFDLCKGAMAYFERETNRAPFLRWLIQDFKFKS